MRGCSWLRKHHSSNRLFSWPQLQSGINGRDWTYNLLQWKLGQRPLLKDELAQTQRMKHVFFFSKFSRTAHSSEEWQCWIYCSTSCELSHLLAVICLLCLCFKLDSWVVSEVPLSNQESSCVWKCFGRDRTASAQCAVVRSMWQLRYILQLNSQWTENTVPYVGFDTSHEIWTR